MSVNFNNSMHLDVDELIWFKRGMMIDIIVLYILILVVLTLTNYHKLRNFWTKSLKAFYFGHIQSHLDYCSPIWGKCAISTSKRLYSLQKRAAKLILHHKIKHTRTIFEELHIMPFHVRINFKTCLLVHKVFNNLAPPNLKCIFNFQCFYGSTRAIAPPAKSDLFKTSFSFNGCIPWNSLPKFLRKIPSLSSFKKELRTFLLIHTIRPTRKKSDLLGLSPCSAVLKRKCICSHTCVCVCVCV